MNHNNNELIDFDDEEYREFQEFKEFRKQKNRNKNIVKEENAGNFNVIDESNNNDIDSKSGYGRFIWTAVIGITVAIGLAMLIQLIINPLIAEKAARDSLTVMGNQKGSITAKNNVELTFLDQNIDSADISQKALGIDETVVTPAAYVYSNNKDNENKKSMHVYVDFSEQKSRDYLLINQNMLKTSIENGVLDLYVHPVASNNAFSVYSTQALATAFTVNPDKAWDYMIALLKTSATVSTNDPNEIIELILKDAEQTGVTIARENIESGSFVSWILTVGNDPILSNSTKIPLITINGKIIDGMTVDINNPESMQKEIHSND